jgi:hypothetical protein
MLPLTDISSQPELFRQQEESTAGMWEYYAHGQKSSTKIRGNPMKLMMPAFIPIVSASSRFLPWHTYLPEECVIIS